MANAEATFRAKAPGIMAQLLRDFPITPTDAAAIVGNAGHESLGFTALQEFKPTVAGSRGGWGWMQWTGPRRKAFEAYCARTGKNPASDDANYAWLFLELKGVEGTEGRAIGKTTAAADLNAKVIAFEKAFLRAGVKHYPSRQQWAKIALDEWRKVLPQGVPIPSPTEPEPGKAPPAPQGKGEGKRPSKGPAAAALAIIIAVLGAAYTFLKSQGLVP
ncbi:phage tail tip lysozyme [Devosia lacusdianchii]|uniref:phage tail tip lysozyme n=1 Tax=Devosia lacusdianchii TaxID=2917991 RepID=UPI001F068B01|nr:phage tail tip lysozyme [Devosia sp. JXJ CY 41]